MSAIPAALESLRIDLLVDVEGPEVEPFAYMLDRARAHLLRGDAVSAYCAMARGPRVRQAMRAEWGADLADRWVALETALEALSECEVAA